MIASPSIQSGWKKKEKEEGRNTVGWDMRVDRLNENK